MNRRKCLDSGSMDTALKLREASHKKVDTSGFVRGVWDAPFFNLPGRATEEQAFFILMKSAYQRKLRSILLYHIILKEDA